MLKKLKHKKLSSIIASVFLFLVILSIFGGYFLSETNLHCLICHREDDGRSFRHQTHPTAVKCYVCHQKKGGSFKRMTSHPYSGKDSVINESCIQCHVSEDHEDVSKYKYNHMEIKITHRKHMEEYDSKCLDCHSNVEHTKLKNFNTRPTEESCEKCHEDNIDQCIMCHQLKSLTAHKPLMGDIDEKVCARCHEGYMDDDRIFEGYVYNHQLHKEEGISCERCHTNEYEHGTLLTNSSDCMICHIIDPVE